MYNMNIGEEMYEGGDVREYNKQVAKSILRNSPISVGLLLLVLLMFALSVLTDVWREGKFSTVISLQTLTLYGANNSTSVIYNHQYYRLITAMLLHAGFIHVFFNSFTIIMYLMRFEPCVSRLHFMLIVGVGGILGNMCTDVVNQRLLERSIIGVGASTCLCAVIGSSFAFSILRVNEMPVPWKTILCQLAYITILSLIPGIDFFGHFGSLIPGFLFGMAFFHPGRTAHSTLRSSTLRNIFKFTLIGYVILLIWGILA